MCVHELTIKFLFNFFVFTLWIGLGMRKVGGWHARAILLRLRAKLFKAVMNNVLVCCTTFCVKADVCSSAFIIIMQKKY